MAKFIRLKMKQFKKNVFSQNGEDGVIEEIFHRLNINSGYLVEFGVFDGVHLSNTCNLYRTGNYDSLQIEIDYNNYLKLKENISPYPKVIAIHRAVSEDSESPNSLDNILKEVKAPYDPDLISIDVDGTDYEIWKSLKNYRPKVIIIETNATFGTDKFHISSDQGTSPASMVQLGNEKGYKLVACTGPGNLFFVDENIFINLM